MGLGEWIGTEKRTDLRSRSVCPSIYAKSLMHSSITDESDERFVGEYGPLRWMAEVWVYSAFAGLKSGPWK